MDSAVPGAADHVAAGDRDEVAEHRGRGLHSPGARAVEHERAGGGGLDEDGVVGAVHGGERMVRGTSAGWTRADTPSWPVSSSTSRSQTARSFTTNPARRAESTCSAVTFVMPSRCTASTGTLVWKARLARMAAFCAAS